MIGINEKEWAPDIMMTKAMVCQVLYRIVGVTSSYDCTKYTDVNPGDWYYDAVAWAASVGVVTDTDPAFGSNDAITYEEFAVMLYNLCNVYGLTMIRFLYGGSGGPDGYPRYWHFQRERLYQRFCDRHYDTGYCGSSYHQFLHGAQYTDQFQYKHPRTS